MGEGDTQTSKTRPPKPKATLFLACFGFPVKPLLRNKSSTGAEPYSEKPSSMRKGRRWLPWSSSSSSSSSRFGSNKSGAKTVPVDPSIAASSEKTKKSKGSSRNSSKSKSKANSDHGKVSSPNPKQHHQNPDAAATKPNDRKPLHDQVQAAAKANQDQASKETTQEQETRNGSEQKIIFGTGNRLDDHVESRTDSTWQRRSSFCRKIDAIRAGLSQPGSPDPDPDPATDSSTVSNSIPRSTSFPHGPAHNKKFSAIGRPSSSNPHHDQQQHQQQKVKLKKPSSSTTRESHGRTREAGSFDPLVGMSIIMVTLIIMLLWGRICAILCTSAWFYFIPRLVNHADDTRKNGSAEVEPDYNSEEYKKRVVLEGLLERNHRCTL